MTDYRTVTACRLCDSTDLTEALKLPDTPLANSLDSDELYPLVVMRCGTCSHHQLSIAVHPDKLWGPDYVYQSGTSPVFRKHLEALADEVAALKPGGRVLEIASNDGTLVRMLRDRGCYVSGVDPSGPEEVDDGPHEWTLIDQLKPGAYALVRTSWPMAMPPYPGQMDIILALNVFAHVDDLHSFTAAVKEALAPDGLFCIEVGYLPEQIRRGQFDTIYSEHFSYHTIRPLERFFNRHGLKIVSAQVVESQGGSLRLRVNHAGKGIARMHVSHSHDRLWDAEEGLDIASLRPIIDARAAALKSALEKLFYRGEMVCIYGAPAKLTTLLYATGLEKMPFNCVGDDNPRKVGRTTPGNHIPIVSVEDMLARKPDTILVASWNFFDDIRRNLRDAGFKGGIINPMATITDWGHERYDD